jgi:hypothetical protein
MVSVMKSDSRAIIVFIRYFLSSSCSGNCGGKFAKIVPQSVSTRDGGQDFFSEETGKLLDRRFRGGQHGDE